MTFDIPQSGMEGFYPLSQVYVILLTQPALTWTDTWFCYMMVLERPGNRTAIIKQNFLHL